jgi:hypothetical protein
MAESIPGGAFQDAQGRWVDANGAPLTQAQVAEAKALHAANDAQLRENERARQALEASRNPAAMAIAAALAPRPEPAAEPKPAKPAKD